MLSPQHIYELFIFDDREFINVAYRTLLGRAPDSNGMNYYLGRLRMGYGKASIIVQLANSSEERPHGNIKGLVNLIKEEQRANHWFWGIFTRNSRLERTLHQVTQATISVRASMNELSKKLDAIQQNLHHIEQRQFLASQSAEQHSATPVTIVQHLSEGDVRQAFTEVLGRLPENEQVTENHAHFANISELKRALMHSDEFKNKAIGEHAQMLLDRLCQAL